MDRRRRHHWTIAFALTLSACSAGNAPEFQGGQTGSAGCTNPPDCVCDAVRAMTVLRGTVRTETPADADSADSAPQLSVEVSEVFTPDAQLAAGEQVAGPFQHGLPCGVTSTDAPPSGTEVLVAFEQGLFVCQPYESCVTECGVDESAAEPGAAESGVAGSAMADADAACVTGCRAQFAADCEEAQQDARLQGTLHLIVWEETLQLNDDVTLPANEAALLVNTEECRQRFATTEEVECSDVF